MSLSVNRLRRPNAGSKMSRLLDTEEQMDHFYDNIYGGFREDENDIDYNCDDSESEDTVDSDFSIDENNESISDDQNEEQLEAKTKSKIKFGFTQSKQKPNQKKLNLSQITTEDMVPLIVERPGMEPMVSSPILSTQRKSLNEIIIKNRLKLSENDSEFEAKDYSEFMTKTKDLTQNELLKEAVITETINLKSLKDWQKLELERVQKSKTIKHSIKGSFIRYHSVSMPLIQELSDNSSGQTSVNKESNESGAKSYSRTFISFSDDQTYDSLLNSLSYSSIKSSKEKICPVTQMPARYLDPISQIPFANIEAFKTIRNKFKDYLEIYGNNNIQKELKEWIERNEECNHWQQNHSSYKSEMNLSESKSQVIQSAPLLPKEDSNRRINRCGRKRKNKY